MSTTKTRVRSNGRAPVLTGVHNEPASMPPLPPRLRMQDEDPPPPPPNVGFAMVFVHVEMALDYLVYGNPRNRPLVERVWWRYKVDMIADRYQFNGESFKVDWDGNLLDGQHRMQAIIESGRGQWMLCVWDLDPATQRNMDIGGKRTVGQSLKIEGEKYGTVRATAAKMIFCYQQTGIPVPKGRKLSPSEMQLYALLERYPELEDSFDAGGHMGPIVSLTRSTIVGLHFLFSYVDREEADEFFDKLNSGAGLHEGSPILTLSRRLARESAARTTLPAGVAVNFTVRAFNAFHRGEELLRLNAGTRFPRIKDCTFPIAGVDEASDE